MLTRTYKQYRDCSKNRHPSERKHQKSYPQAPPGVEVPRRGTPALNFSNVQRRPARQAAGQVRGWPAGKGGESEDLEISLCRSVLTLFSVCPHFVLSPPLTATPHGCWLSLICPQCPSVFAGKYPACAGAGAGQRHAARWGSFTTLPVLRPPR